MMLTNYSRYVKLFAALGVVTLSFLSTSLPAHADTPVDARVEIKDFMFHPTNVKLKVGAMLTWVNKDEEPHTVTSETGLFRSGAMDTNDTFVFKFDKPGTYHFLCSIHPQMVGTIVVE
jgi:plastocyanin